MYPYNHKLRHGRTRKGIICLLLFPIPSPLHPHAHPPYLRAILTPSQLGPKYRLALRIARDERWERARCDHKGIYADDCIVSRVQTHKIYLVATNDRDLKRRIRKIPGVPILSVARGKYVVERLPDAPEK